MLRSETCLLTENISLHYSQHLHSASTQLVVRNVCCKLDKGWQMYDFVFSAVFRRATREERICDKSVYDTGVTARLIAIANTLSHKFGFEIPEVFLSFNLRFADSDKMAIVYVLS